MAIETYSINFNEIEKELKSVWGKAAQTSSIDGAISRACLSNLIIYTEDPNDEEVITQVFAEFMGKHPSRAILVIAAPKSSVAKIAASVSTHTQAATGAPRSIACEQVTLHVSGSAIKDIASAIQPMLVPDLPVYLWWRGTFLTQKALVEKMLTFVNRFIYDGVTWTDLSYTVPQVSECFEKYKDLVGFTNFNWSRLRPWREYAADFFDPGLFEEEVWDINRVQVEYMALPGMEEGYRFRALLFVSWLATQLEWKPIQGKAGNNIVSFQFENKKGVKVDADLLLIPQTSEMGQSIQKITMGIENKDKSQQFIIQRDHADRVMTLTTCQNQNNCSILRKVPHVDSSPAELLFRELGRRIRHGTFEKSFKLASTLVQMI